MLGWALFILLVIEHYGLHNNEWGELTTKVDEASNARSDTYSWLLIGGIIALNGWVSNTWWFSCHLDDIWVSHLHKHYTTTTIFHNHECGVGRFGFLSQKIYIIYIYIYNHECYPLSYDTLDFVGEVGKLGGIMCLWGVDQLALWVFYIEKPIRQHVILPMTTLKTWHNQYWH